MFPLVYFVRHGQTDWNAEHRLQGQADIDINALGRAPGRPQRPQAGRTDRRSRRSSISWRARSPHARDDGAASAPRWGLPPDGYRTDPRLIEVHFGDWQGFTFAELEAAKPGIDAPRAARQMEFRAAGRCAPKATQMLLGARAALVRGAAQADGLRHPWRRHPRAFQDGRRIARNEAAALDIAQDRVLRFEDGQAGMAVTGSARRRLFRQFHVGDQVLAADLVIGEHDLHAFLERRQSNSPGSL